MASTHHLSSLITLPSYFRVRPTNPTQPFLNHATTRITFFAAIRAIAGHARKFLSPPPKGRLAVLDMIESFGLFGFFFLDRFPLMGAGWGAQGGDEDGGAGRGKACISVRMKNRVEFGEYVAVLGSSEEMGGWERKVPMRWTEEGWVAELEIEKEERVLYKFVIVGGDGKLVWEGGGNRVRELEKGGRFQMVCHWDETGETGNVVELNVFDEDEEEEEEVDGVDDPSAAADTSSVSEVAPSPFVQDWQGREGS